MYYELKNTSLAKGKCKKKNILTLSAKLKVTTCPCIHTCRMVKTRSCTRVEEWRYNPIIVDLGTRRIYSGERPRFQFEMRLGASQSQTGRCREKNIVLAFPLPSAQYPFDVLIHLSELHNTESQ
jgi:hypothetical protein